MTSRCGYRYKDGRTCEREAWEHPEWVTEPHTFIPQEAPQEAEPTYAWPLPESQVDAAWGLTPERRPQEAESEEELKPQPGEVWKHRSGHLYRVLMLAMWEPNLTTCVVYQRVGGEVVPIREWVRPMDVFLERFTLHERAPESVPTDEATTWRCDLCGQGFNGALVGHGAVCPNRQPVSDTPIAEVQNYTDGDGMPDYPSAEEMGFVYCRGCSEAGGADRPIYHKPPVCKSSRDTPIASEEE